MLNTRHFSSAAPPATNVYRPGGSWLRPAVLGLALVLAAQGCGCSPVEQGKAVAADVTVLPRPARDALDRAAKVYPQPLSGAKWSSVFVTGGTDHPVFQVRGTNGRGNAVELEVTKAGRVIEVEEHGIPLSEVPAPVVEALKVKMPQFILERAEAIYQIESPRPVSYGFEGKDADGKAVEVYVSADGKTFLN